MQCSTIWKKIWLQDTASYTSQEAWAHNMENCFKPRICAYYMKMDFLLPYWFLCGMKPLDCLFYIRINIEGHSIHSKWRPAKRIEYKKICKSMDQECIELALRPWNIKMWRAMNKLNNKFMIMLVMQRINRILKHRVLCEALQHCIFGPSRFPSSETQGYIVGRTGNWGKKRNNDGGRGGGGREKGEQWLNCF